MSKIKLGITIGDVNGIGLEVILKTLADPRIFKFCIPIIYASIKVISYHKNTLAEDLLFDFHNIQNAEEAQEGKINVMNCWQENVNITLGKLADVGGKYAYKSLEFCMKDIQNGLIDGMVTAPIHKKAMQMVGFPFPGHTEYITQQTKTENSLMFLVSDNLRVGVVTGHIPLKDVAKKINKDLIINKIRTMNEALQVDFDIDRPRIAVLGLNPHAGDEGLLGDEEQKIILPAIDECKRKGILAFGPYPADGFFGSGQSKKFDGVLAMYHDQGLVAFKALSFTTGVNYTAGLPIVRTSPDHGTAFSIAGKNEADATSFRQALFLAKDIALSRANYMEMREDAVIRKERPLEDVLSNDNELNDLLVDE